MRFRSAREARGWSQEHLAAASGVSLRTVQRAEAGSRISPENTLALCATLDIEPAHARPPETAGPRTLPHLRTLRAELDRALAEFGERPLWQKGDASPVLRDALKRMGLAEDAVGFAEAQRRVARHHGRLELAEALWHPFAFAWVIGLLMLPACIMALVKDFSANCTSAGPLVMTWVLGTVPLAMFMLWHERAFSRISPMAPQDIEAATIVLSDLRPVEAALTRDYLWVSEMAFRKVRVTRISLAAIRDVGIVRTMDGFHSARFRVDGPRPLDDGETATYELTRLRDEEVRWLDRRFGSLRKAVVWSPAMA